MENIILNKINNTKEKDLSLYIHIPFCESRCYYCDFYSSVLDENTVDKYFKYLNREIDIYKDFLKDKNIVSIFFGGGTPSSVDAKYITDVLNNIKSKSNIDKNCEITIESNPNSLTEDKLIQYINSGFNRFSMGTQSFNEKILKSIGRIHKKEDIIKAINLLNKYNVVNYSFDLMLALPYQKFEDIKESIEMIKILNPAHISYYSLIIEDNTTMQKIYKNNTSIFPSEEEDRKMYHYVVNTLKELGYYQYEISNFAKKNFNSIHNSRYWTLNNYLGFGASAHSNIDNIRFFNANNFNEYFNLISEEHLPVLNYEVLDNTDRINEYVIMGLRMNTGVNISEAAIRFEKNLLEYYKDEIQKTIEKGLIEIKNNNIILTEMGRDLSNQVEIDFIKLK